MTRFPIQYDVELERGGSGLQELHAGDRPRITVGPPLEFGGSNAWWSPEHLLVSATSACFAATFLAAAERAHIAVEGYHCHSKGILDRSGDGAAFTSIVLAVRLRVKAIDTRRAHDLLVDTKRHCFVANTLRCPVELAAEVDPS